MAEVNSFFPAPSRPHLVQKFVSIDDPSLPTNWCGGYKGFEQPLYLAGINYLEWDEFIEHLRENVNWSYREHVQLMLCGPNDDEFEVIKPGRKAGKPHG